MLLDLKSADGGPNYEAHTIIRIGRISGPYGCWQCPGAFHGGSGHGVTFTKDVAPVLQRSCQVCHRPDSIAPMSLLTYEEVRPWARGIKAQVVSRAMPPWTLDKNVGIQRFKGDRSLSDAEINTIVTWVDADAPRGNPADMPPPRQFPDVTKWTLLPVLGEPDLIVPIPEPFTMEADSPNLWTSFTADSGLIEDRWVKAIETKPSAEGFPIVHHAITSIVAPGGGRGFYFGEYAIGKTGDVLGENSGLLVKAHSKVRFGMHYAAVGKRTTDRTALALWFHPKGFLPKYKQERNSVAHVMDLDIPPGEGDVRTDSYYTLPENTRLVVFQPHLHNRGKRQCLEAIYPDTGTGPQLADRVETINCVNWNFGWHIAYNYEDDVQPLLPKGTTLHVITWHDNSRANKWNPDPRNWVGFGQRSSDDMAFAHLSWYTLSDEDFKQAVAERNGRRTEDALARRRP